MTKIWIDLDNTPHVPFFAPIIAELEQHGHEVVITARDAFQVCELADEMGIPYTRIGSHWGRHLVMKVLGLLWRAGRLLRFAARHRPDIAVSHGSRAQVLLSNTLGIPTIVADDYECSRTVPFAHPKWVIVPEAITDEDLWPNFDRSRVRRYRGLKEDVYVPRFVPDAAELRELSIPSNDVIVIVRPPADEAHYRNAESDVLFAEVMSLITRSAGARAVLVPRTQHQEESIRHSHPEWFVDDKTRVPTCAVNGLNLLWHSDLVVSGGGTMNREAAALGVPAYSIFRGETGAVDRSLEREGRLTIVRTPEEVRTIPLTPRTKTGTPSRDPRPALADIVGHIEDIMRIESGGAA